MHYTEFWKVKSTVHTVGTKNFIPLLFDLMDKSTGLL